MKKNLYALLLGISPFLISCQKEELIPASEQGKNNTTLATERVNCEPFPFGILGLDNGTLLIDGIDYLTGDVGYSPGILSTTNRQIHQFDGSALVHSLAGSFLFNASTYAPANGITQNEWSDGKIQMANVHAVNLTTSYAALAPHFTIGNITNNRTITSAGETNTIVNINSVDISNKTITLVGNEGMDEGFILNINGILRVSESNINLVNIRPERVLFNMKNSSTVTIDRANFNGTILSKNGIVYCFEPETFEGSIIAKNVYLFSYGSILTGGGSNNATASTGGTPTSNCYWITNFVQRTYCNGYQWD